MADVVVTVALETIRDLLIEEGKFLFGVRDQVKELQGELEALQSFLTDAMARRHEEERVRTSVRQAKLLAYKAEDIIEGYAIKVASKRGGGGFRKIAKRAACFVGEGIAIHKVGNEIGEIKTEIANLIRRLESYGINRIIEAQPSSATIDQQRRQRITYAHEEGEYFVAMEDDVSRIVKWVTEDDMIHRVISICGTGGLGKTTIAMKVFKHIRKSSFKCFAWVSVTQNCQVKMLLQDILKQILGEDKGKEVRDLEETELVRKLYDVLKNKKCFVVLDDIWKLDDWRSLSVAFPIFEGSSKILLTTRITEVAEVAQQDSRHEPELLNEKDGWDLLTKIAFNHQEGQGSTLPKQVELVGRDMLRKCGGLPLAISLLGGILKNKDPLIEWVIVNKEMVTVLAFSYYDLPSYLRPCFLYMSCFREDEEIDVTRLYQLWIADGLVPTRPQGQEETLMDVASDFLHELISRNMVQLLVRHGFNDEKSCRLHNLIRELCLEKGREEEFMNVTSAGEVGSVSVDGVDLCRQAILVDSKNYQCEISIAKSTGKTCFRALIFNARTDCFVEGTIKFKRLRSLVLDNCRFKDNKLPKEIRDMIHLRYLSLQNSLQNGELPVFIGDLQHIQILDVCSYNLQLPNIFHKMKRLRYLYLHHERVQSKSGKRLEFHGLNELEVLDGMDSRYDQLTHLSKSLNLRRLEAEIWGYEDLSTVLEQLSSLLKLQYVCITFVAKNLVSLLDERFPDVKKLLLCPSLHKLELWSPIGNFPIYEHKFWPQLVNLRLISTKFEEDPMPFLQELPNLRSLQMYKDAYVGKEMYCSSKAFPKLTYLQIHNLPNIEKWRMDAGAFPNLETLRIWSCESFEEIVPDGLTNITTLAQIDINNMPEEFIERYGSKHNNTNQSPTEL